MRKYQFRSGFTIIETLIALGIMSIVAFMVARFMLKTTASNKAIELRDELDLLRYDLIQNIDCDKTFSNHTPAINPAMSGSQCGANSGVGGLGTHFLRLVRKTVDPYTVQFMTGPLLNAPGKPSNGSATYGSWRLWAACSASDDSLIVRATRMDANGNLIRDPLTQLTRSLYDPKSLLIGKSAYAVPSCFVKNKKSEQNAAITFGVLTDFHPGWGPDLGGFTSGVWKTVSLPNVMPSTATTAMIALIQGGCKISFRATGTTGSGFSFNPPAGYYSAAATTFAVPVDATQKIDIRMNVTASPFICRVSLRGWQ